MHRLGLIDRYRKYLPVTSHTPVVSLGEGSTPLVMLERISDRLGVEVWAKLEGLNPTGSFKDRGMTLAISKAVEEGSRAVICASTGNTSAAAAAYAAKAGLRCVVLIPDGKVAAGKLAQAQILGARVVQLRGNFDQALEAVRLISDREPITLVNNLNPYRLEGQKTAAFEILHDLGAVDWVSLPVGNAGNITAYWRGANEWAAAHPVSISRLPHMLGCQAAGAAAMVVGADIEHPETVATAIRIGKPVRRDEAKRAVTESGGGFVSCSDEAILDAYQLLASEGVWCEPASATSLAGVRAAVKRGTITPGSRVVCILTGNGLKDPDTAVSVSQPPVRAAADDMAALTRLCMAA